MAIEHVERPILGWQFHPESVLTEHGFELLAAFLRQIGLETPESMPSLRQELLHDWPANRTWFQQRISMQDLAT
jgi:hypothetical protein